MLVFVGTFGAAWPAADADRTRSASIKWLKKALPAKKRDGQAD